MAPLTAAQYYRDPDVRARIREYCGAGSDGDPTCAFVVPLCPGPLTRWETARPRALSSLDHVFDCGCDLARSMLDAASLVVHIDVDYCENALAGDALLRPGHAFLRLEPVFRTIRFELARLDLPLLDVLTGRGYHFTARVPLAAPIVDRLAELGRQAAARAAATRPAPDVRRDHAFVGMSMVLEHLAHAVLRRAAPITPVPLIMNGTEVGRGGIGRESVSIDLSYGGDLLERRHIRVAFGTYQNHTLRPDIFGAEAAGRVPVFAVIPRGDRPLVWMLEHARSLEQARALAARVSAVLPDASHGLSRLLDEYLMSPLSEAHCAFYSAPPHPPAEWARTYDRLDASSLPPCVAKPLARPNDALLKPTAVQHVTRALLSRGWHPRHIAGLLRSKYERDLGWGDRWTWMDSVRRAEYDVRVFAGLVATGMDEAIDFNCVSAQEKGLCPGGACGHDLRTDRPRLLQQVLQ